MKTKIVSFRISTEEKKELEEAQKKLGFPNLSKFVMFLWQRLKGEIK